MVIHSTAVTIHVFPLNFCYMFPASRFLAEYALVCIQRSACCPTAYHSRRHLFKRLVDVIWLACWNVELRFAGGQQF